MIIRKATIEDKKSIAYFLFLAMEDIVYQFIGQKSQEAALLFLEQMAAQKNNQYSYENCWIAEDNQIPVATINIYDGAMLETLKKPIKTQLQSMFSQNFNFEDETASGEMYIDCIGVHPNWQGKGIGSKLILFLIEEYVQKNNQTLGLLVDKKNPSAKRLYLKLGFKKIGEKTLAGNRLDHLQISKT